MRRHKGNSSLRLHPNSFMKKLRDYYFVDEHRVRVLTDQIKDRFSEESSFRWTMGASLAGPKFESNLNRTWREPNIHERIDLLAKCLANSGDLFEGRPQTTDAVSSPGPRYVIEHVDAVKLIVPASSLQAVSNLKSFALWVSDPDFSIRPKDRWDFVGSFLYLVEAHWDDSPFHTTYSGRSALQAIVNSARGLDLMAFPKSPIGSDGCTPPEFWEPLGRGNADHPIEKLQRIGAVVSDKRRITTLYRLRYMTNEQCVKVDGETRRFNDILGYPVYIASAL